MFFLWWFKLQQNKNMDCSIKNTRRIKLVYSDDKYSYIIILEQNKKDMYIVSSYLIDEPGYLEKVLKEYDKYKKVP